MTLDEVKKKYGAGNYPETVMHNPVSKVLFVPVEMVEFNDHNPNSVAANEMKLLYTSINHDGYTMPVVTIWDEENQKFTIVDGAHRTMTLRRNKDLYDLNEGLLPIVVIEKDINNRMSSTIRHNRARGKHSVDGNANVVFEMLGNGWDDTRICNELGMEIEELVRLKHVTGFSKLFKDVEYGKSWVTPQQIKIMKQHREEEKNGRGN